LAGLPHDAVDAVASFVLRGLDLDVVILGGGGDEQIAASHVVLYEGETQVIYSVALHIAKRKISGIETLVYRVPADAKPKPDLLGKPLVGMNEPVPAGKGMPRAEMVRVALSYPEGLRLGSFVKGKALVTFEAFKIRDGAIHAVNAFLAYLPKETERGWPSAE
jgi:hypothetical protein